MKMIIKRIKYLALALMFVACADDINEVRPSDQLEVSDFLSTVSDFNAFLNGGFQQLQNYYAFELLVLGDIPSDNVIQSQTGRLSNDVYWDWRYTSLNDIGLLDEGYEAVNIANRIIGNIEALPEGENRDNILGQAYAMRALAHFDMVRVYGQIPTQSAGANASLGIPYITFEDGDTEDPFADPERETVESNYNNIVEDFQRALTLITDTEDEIVNRFTDQAIHGLLSRVYLYMGQYQNAIDAANQVTATVAARANLEDVFRDASNDGVLMKLGIDQALDGLSAGVVYSQGTIENGVITNNVSEYAMAYDLFTAIDPNDIRGDAFVFQGTNEGQTYNAVKKWLGEEGQINGETDMPVIRVAEVKLNEAEAYFELGQEPEALSTLNDLRDNRYTSYTGGESGQALEDAIEFERRLEMFAEYNRFFDIKRAGEAVERATFGDLSDGTGTPPANLTLPAGDHRFQLPIPQTEIQANPNFEQNPGYTN